MITYDDINITYDEFIQDIINTRGQWNIPEGEYFERHHITPRCLNGEGKTSEKHPNLIWLYPKEHFIAHYLLTVKYPDEPKLNYAFKCMLYENKSTKDLEKDAELYEHFKIVANKNNPFNTYSKDLPAEERLARSRLGIEGHKQMLQDPVKYEQFITRLKEYYKNQDPEEKRKKYDKSSNSLKIWYNNENNKEIIEQKRLHNQETNKIKSRLWRDDFISIFHHTAEYYRKYKLMGKALSLYQDIKDLDNEERIIKANEFNLSCQNMEVCYFNTCTDDRNKKIKDYHQENRNKKSKYLFYFDDITFGNIYDLKMFIKDKYKLEFLPSDKIIWCIINNTEPAITSPKYSKNLYFNIKGCITFKEKEC